MDAALHRQTLGDLLRRSGARTPDKLATRLRRDPLDLRRVRRGRPPAGRRAGRARRRDGRPLRGPVAQLARLRGAALRGGAARRGAGADQLHAQCRRGRLHPAHSGARMLAVDTGLAALARAAPRSAPPSRNWCGCRARASDRAGGVPDRFDDLSSVPSAAAWPELTGADLAQIVYTSGTESRPKGAMLHARRGDVAVRQLHRRRRDEPPTTSTCTRCRCITARSSTSSSARRSTSARPT